jgi:hypothetical protein
MTDRFKEASRILHELSKDLDWIENEFSPSNATEEERSFVKGLREVAYNKFDESAWRLGRMFMPIQSKGKLFLNSAGRYQIENTDKYFTCGDYCEVFLPFYDGDEDNYTWIPTAIEARNREYYFVARPDTPMTGALVRTRGF